MFPDYKTKTGVFHRWQSDPARPPSQVPLSVCNNYGEAIRQGGKRRFAFYGVFRLLKIEKNLQYV
jgi:hypothetical protein